MVSRTQSRSRWRAPWTRQRWWRRSLGGWSSRTCRLQTAKLSRRDTIKFAAHTRFYWVRSVQSVGDTEQADMETRLSLALLSLSLSLLSDTASAQTCRPECQGTWVLTARRIVILSFIFHISGVLVFHLLRLAAISGILYFQHEQVRRNPNLILFNFFFVLQDSLARAGPTSCYQEDLW